MKASAASAIGQYESLVADCALRVRWAPEVEVVRALMLATGQRVMIGSLNRTEDVLAGSARFCLATAGGDYTL